MKIKKKKRKKATKHFWSWSIPQGYNIGKLDGWY